MSKEEMANGEQAGSDTFNSAEAYKKLHPALVDHIEQAHEEANVTNWMMDAADGLQRESEVQSARARDETLPREERLEAADDAQDLREATGRTRAEIPYAAAAAGEAYRLTQRQPEQPGIISESTETGVTDSASAPVIRDRQAPLPIVGELEKIATETGEGSIQSVVKRRRENR